MRLVLRQHTDLANTGINAVGKRKIDDAKFAAKGGGRFAARRAMYMACWVVIQRQPEFKARYEALRQKGKCAKVALIACMRVLLIRLNAMIRDGAEWKERAV